MDSLKTSLEYLKGIGPNRAELIKNELKVSNYQDLLYFFPIRYIDRTRFYNINEIPKNNSEVQIKGTIVNLKIQSKKKGKILIASFRDKTGIIDLVWFRGYKWIKEKIKINSNYVVFGKISWYLNTPKISHPEIILENDFDKQNQLSIHPIYSSTEKLISKGISQKVLKNAIRSLFDRIGSNFIETIPRYLLSELNLMSKSEAINQIHFPSNLNKITYSSNRLKFEELFYLQLQLIRKNIVHKHKIKGLNFNKVGELFNTFYSNYLPFSLTKSQKRVMKEIRYDMGTGKHMNRLLQGDVGSGKTIVSFLSMLIALDNDYQSCLMAPTEILAQQHYDSLTSLSEKMNINISLLTGSTNVKERKFINNGLLDGSINIIIGTHTLIEDNVKFKNLGIAIIDEQHKFGVAQRSKLWKKNLLPPHILIMTATPIPRTLAMTAYGDLDISIIDELPPGRKEIKTFLKDDSKRLEVFSFIKKEINSGRQIYIVYPLIEESEKMDYKDLMDGYESISREFPLPKYKISILYGKMKPDNKKYEMDRFVNGYSQIMVATTVIEVGVNVSNASVMIIESAERFGLSQLHQLRGRVGRGDYQSYCILMSKYNKSDDAKIRLNTLVESNDGFKIADVDLKLRGPGNIMGTKQSGILQLKIADLIKDYDLLKLSRKIAIKVLNDDPDLIKTKNIEIRKGYSLLNLDKNIWNYIS